MANFNPDSKIATFYPSGVVKMDSIIASNFDLLLRLSDSDM